MVSVVHSVLQCLELSLHLSWKISSNLLSEVGSQLLCLLLPERPGHIEQGAHIHIAAQTFGVDGTVFRQPANNAFLGCLILTLSVAALENPLQDAGILTKSWPEEGTGRRILPEPVDVEDLGQLRGGLSALHAQPVSEVVTKVVTKEGPHGKGVMHNYLA